MLRRMNGDRSITDDQLQCAALAAPYVHPRLNSSDVTLTSDNVVRIISEQPMTIQEWCAQNGVSSADNDAVAPTTIEGSVADAD
jgi:hypothetical protein